MLRKILLGTTLGLSILTFSQSDEKRSFIGANLGLSIPTSQYASFEEEGGFASTGLNANLDGAYMFTPYLGLGGSLGFFRNVVNAEEYLKYLDKSTGGALSNGATVETTSWSTSYFLFGPHVSLPVNKITLDFRLLTGFLSTSSPTLKIKDPVLGNFEQTSATATSLGYGFGFGGRYNLSEKIALKANMDFIGGNQEYEFKDSNSGEVTKSNTNITALNFNIGICYQFIK